MCKKNTVGSFSFVEFSPSANLESVDPHTLELKSTSKSLYFTPLRVSK